MASSGSAADGVNVLISFVVLQAVRKNQQSREMTVELMLFKTEFVSCSVEVIDLIYQVGKRHAVFIQPVVRKA